MEAASRSTRSPLLPAYLAAIILGILGMHSFAHHQPPTGDGTPHHSAAVSSAADRSTGHLTHAVAVAAMTEQPTEPTAAPAKGGTTAATVPKQGRPTGDMVMLCAAMLLAAASGVLLALRLRRLAPSTRLRLAVLKRAIRATLGVGVGAGPPAVWEFSVIRC